MTPLLDFEWPLPVGVSAAVTCRRKLPEPFGADNFALHVGDDPEKVRRTRAALAEQLGVGRWQWLNQVHGCETHAVDLIGCEPVTADAAHTCTPGVACAVLTADCLPVLLACQQGTQVAAAHAGWRGLAGGIIENTMSVFQGRPVTAFLGPAIGPHSFEVGAEVREAFIARLGGVALSAFRQSPRGGDYFFADLYQLARLILQGLGVHEIYGGHWDTLGDDRFYSYRREKVTGRLVSAIWMHQ